MANKHEQDNQIEMIDDIHLNVDNELVNEEQQGQEIKQSDINSMEKDDF